ncbi:MAG: hypothetical protein A2233_05625 [Candidatus Kerfeldbacteria bacterium RIFOXYA2_FULL_38_24]|uniref:Uncharacterized protein n=1 Tax=Candidatus Kerfeldbacteria bacterium RIFOXYB2_FULL_38_14 TaxID=1798547 RepID=A0A1G2BAT3_9BACT|nr:MAG: hypothetical protein A2233_05625 [Candidatus Kerfeldbacteria bacterium RIFOXYA2_FULL_38_24]OGY86232.1 MAG: hypothetical protein A2319_01170 [Candidatus Kerfeldbacteria bacterium RIFOXYB2_FULL_38_14]OGY88610.1 MAG: hypothetical protein A2458_00545 [Candidatus Kerfeldbacteria bacterium RIFOXYC2_FULL_38_9]
MISNNIRKLQKKIDKHSFDIFMKLLIIVSIFCQLFVSWIAFVWSIGSFIELDIVEGIVALVISIVSIFFRKGVDELCNKLNYKWE